MDNLKNFHYLHDFFLFFGSKLIFLALFNTER